MELKPVPERIKTLDHGNEETSRIKEAFFGEIIDYLREKYRDGITHPSEIEMRSGELAYRGKNQLMSQVTNDRVTLLIYRESVIAAVIETRDDYNATRFVFHRNLEGIEPRM